MNKKLILALTMLLAIANLQAQSGLTQITSFKTDVPFTSIAIDNNNQVFAGTNGRGLWKYEGGTWKNWSGLGLAFSRSNMRQLAIKNNELWVASSGYVLYLGSGEAGNNNNFWGGVHKIDTRFPLIRTYYRGRPVLGQNPAQGPPTRNVLGILIDSTGTPWCAASYHDSVTYPAVVNYNARYHYAPGAVGRFNGSNFSFITGAALPNPTGILIGVGNNYVDDNYSIGKRRTCRSIVQKGNEVWVGADGYTSGGTITPGILRYDLAGNYLGKYEQSNTTVPFGTANTDFGPWALATDSNGKVWAAMNGNKGLAVFDSSGWTYVGVPSILPSTTVFRANSIATDKQGRAYFGTSAGLLMYKGKGSYTSDTSYQLFTTAQGMSSNSVFSIAVGKDGSIWAATTAGVNKIVTGDLFIYTLKPNTTNNSITNVDSMRRLIATYNSNTPQAEIDKDTLYIAADGSNVTVMKWAGSNAKNLKFRIQDGSAPTDTDLQGFFTVRYQDPVANDSLRVQYRHPKLISLANTSNLQLNGKILRLQIVDTTEMPEKIMMDIPLKIMLPPVMLVHGLWSAGDGSQANAWEGMKNYLMTNETYRYPAYQLYAPSYDGAREFTHNRQFIAGFLDHLIERCGNNKFSVGKVDVAGHSMGGILSRLYLQEGGSPYYNNIHKLITINTPHSGSPLANIVGNKDAAFKWVLAVLGRDPFKGALNNLSIGKFPIDTLLNGDDRHNNNVPSHSIYSQAELSQTVVLIDNIINTFLGSPIKLAIGNTIGFKKYGGWVLAVQRLMFLFKYWLMKNTSCGTTDALGPCLEKIYNGKHDLIVSELSQTGRLANTTQIFGYNHLEIVDAPPCQAQVLKLWREPENSTLLTDAGWNPAKLRWNPANGTEIVSRPFTPAATDSIKFVSPVFGTAYNRGDSVTVTVRPSAGIKKMLLVTGYESGIDAIGVNAADSLFGFKVPADVAYQMNMQIIGFDANGAETTDSTMITINPGAGVTLDSIRFLKLGEGNSQKIIVNDSVSVTVMGYYTDGTERNITAMPGIVYSSLGGFTSASANGQIRGTSVGFDQIQAAIAGKLDTTLVEVLPVIASGSPSITYTFNGNGNWSNPANWRDGNIPPAILPIGAQIYIDPMANGACLLNVSVTLPASAKITVLAGKTFTITGGLIIQR
jgi:pimeloyl-ACP methyl ester carboxylesterase